MCLHHQSRPNAVGWYEQQNRSKLDRFVKQEFELRNVAST